MGPTPVCVDGDSAGGVGATGSSALGPGQRRLGLGGGCAGLLRAAGRGEESRNEGSSLRHLETIEDS